MEARQKYPKVLLVSDATWANNNNIGNTFSNLFGDWRADRIAMVYARADLPQTEVCSNYFQIAENRLIRQLVDPSVQPGVKLTLEQLESKIDSNVVQDEQSGKRLYSFFRRYRWSLFLTARNLLWKAGNWKTAELDRFIAEFDPDVVFLLACEEPYMNRLQKYVVEKSNKRAAIYFVDDIYSANRVSLSPFFWINKFWSRASIRETLKATNRIYTIVDKQKREYDGYFVQESDILNKGGNFSERVSADAERNTPLKLVYTGNIIAGRWETLAKIGAALDELNREDERAVLYIYSRTELNPAMKQAFEASKSLIFKGEIPAAEVREIQEAADILVHVESFKLQEKLSTRLSFSTKLVDYFERGKCILAIGWEEAASIEYLAKHEAALVVSDLAQLLPELKSLIENPDLIADYGKQAWDCGRKNHQLKQIREKLLRDLIELTGSDGDVY